MIAITIDDFMIELKDGAIKNVGPAVKSAEAKLFDVDQVTVRSFGDKRVKLIFADDDGNSVQIALFPEAARELVGGIERLETDSPVFE